MLKFLGAVALSAAMAAFVMSSPALANHVGCGDTITADTTLDGDLINCPADGIIIGADNITLNLNGHAVDGDGGFYDDYGIDLSSGHDNVSITNGTVREFGSGIFLYNTYRSRIQGLTVSRNVADGILLRGEESSFNEIIGNTVTDSEVASGIWVLEVGEGNRVEGNAVSGNSNRGIDVSYWGKGTLVRNNAVFDNVQGIIVLYATGPANQVQGNRVWGNRIQGIGVFDSSHYSITRNVVTDNGLGLAVHEAGDGMIEDNVFSTNETDGIFVSTSSGTLRRNAAASNGGRGIFVAAGATWLVQKNRAWGNADDGIRVESVSSPIQKNTANENGDFGIEAVEGAIDGGGNKAQGNANPLECSNVQCK